MSQGKIKSVDQIMQNFKVPTSDMQIITDDCQGQCTHQIIMQKDCVREAIKPYIPAKQYKFKLDTFQSKAIDCIEQNESVLVAAHTSAGKTAVAEYAIAKSLNDKQKVIYTSPIKALSNQKYRQFCDEFQDVGLITGDVSINQNAACLVMTTEILRQMLYKGSEVTREVKWVIFDEVHYLRDKERGVVWEETIILCSPNIRYVFLSATIPNALEFAQWICHIKKQTCHVVFTNFRPVPLQHYLFPSGGEGIYLVVDDKKQFRRENFEKALAVLGEDSALADGRKKKKRQTEGSDLFKILDMAIKKSFYPVIVFSFSKKEVEQYATSMTQFDLTNEQEKESIQETYQQAIEQLSEEDRQLPQIQQMLPILKRGIGIHHGGLLPIVKEIIELLFQEGWLKALFSTETFSMGLNMPAKTVIFTTVRKWDGEENRWITGAEYIQMSGRAGRRGIDDRGLTILMMDEKMEPDVAEGMLKGVSDSLNSSFHLGYNMLLNSMRIQGYDPEYIIRRSFHQFQSDQQMPIMLKEYNELQQKFENIQIQNEKSIQLIIDLQQKIEKIQCKIHNLICTPENFLPFLSIGRLVYVKKDEQSWSWGISLNFNKKQVNLKKQKQQLLPNELYVVDVMLHIKKRKKNEEPQPIQYDQEGEMEVIPFPLSSILEISAVRIMLPEDLTLMSNKNKIKHTVKQIIKQFNGQIPALNPLQDMKINNEKVDSLFNKKNLMIKDLEKQQAIIPSQELQSNVQLIKKKCAIQQSLQLLQNQLKNADKLVLADDLKNMKRVLRRLNYIDQDDIIQAKGRVACEISACDELAATELIFQGILQDQEPSCIAALLSTMVFDENQSDEKYSIKNQQLGQLFSKFQEIAKNIHQVFVDSKLQIDEKDYLNSFKPQIMELVYAWCKGCTFNDLCRSTEIFEGSIIRCMRRLDELLKQLIDAAKTISNSELEQKFEQASSLLKRGIIFAASLYT